MQGELHQICPSFSFFLRNKDSSVVPHGGVFGLLLLIIVLLSLSYLPATCARVDGSRPQPWGRPTQALCLCRGARGALTVGVLLQGAQVANPLND